MEQPNIEQYVLGKLRSGVAPEALKEELLLVGWSESEVRGALAKGLAQHGVPVPGGSVGALGGKPASTVDVVVNFFSFILLGIVATAFGVLYYQIINYFFPDPLLATYNISYDPSRSAMHYAMSAIFIGFPFYFFVMRLWFRRFFAESDRVESKLSKWLTYLVLLVAAVTILGDFITSIYFLLQGEMTARFFLKALTILLISGGVFGFYFFERQTIQMKKTVRPCVFRAFVAGATLLAVVGVILGFVVGGSPATERLRALDRQRSDDLSRLSGCVSNFGREYKRLPATLAELELSSGSYCAPEDMKDPETGLPYEYMVREAVRQNGAVLEGTFELCADFSLSTETDKTLPASAYQDTTTKWYTHQIGKSCDTEMVVLVNDLSTVPKGVAPIPAPLMLQ